MSKVPLSYYYKPAASPSWRQLGALWTIPLVWRFLLVCGFFIYLFNQNHSILVSRVHMWAHFPDPKSSSWSTYGLREITEYYIDCSGAICPKYQIFTGLQGLAGVRLGRKFWKTVSCPATHSLLVIELEMIKSGWTVLFRTPVNTLSRTWHVKYPQ